MSRAHEGRIGNQDHALARDTALERMAEAAVASTRAASVARPVSALGRGLTVAFASAFQAVEVAYQVAQGLVGARDSGHIEKYANAVLLLAAGRRALLSRNAQTELA
jgi:hypothetical protein